MSERLRPQRAAGVTMTTLARLAALTASTSIVLVAFSGAALAEQESLSAARDLYAGAKYEDALVVLDRLRQADRDSAESRSIEQYRAFCLLALGRAADAERAIEAVVRAEPFYRPSSSEVSPRLRAAFSDVRRRMLPAIVQQRYATAKSAYDRKDWVEAEAGFKQVLDVMNDPDLASAASQSALSDLKTLAAGFHDLSAAAAAPPPPPPPPPPVAPKPEPPPAVPVPPRIYTLNDPKVVPPVALRQTLPPFPATQTLMATTTGSLEVVIDEHGAVESAVMRSPLSATYDRQVVAAARMWQYRPAMLDGKPVKFKKFVQINVKR